MKEQKECKDSLMAQQNESREKAVKIQEQLDKVLNEVYEPSSVGAFQQNYLR